GGRRVPDARARRQRRVGDFYRAAFTLLPGIGRLPLDEEPRGGPATAGTARGAAPPGHAGPGRRLTGWPPPGRVVPTRAGGFCGEPRRAPSAGFNRRRPGGP